MTSLAEALRVTIVMTGVTAGLRAFPFIFFRKRKPPAALLFVRDSLPPAIMTLLALSSYKDVQWTRAPYGLPELLAGLVVALLHLWKRNPFLSIFGGTAFYMALTRTDLVRWIFGG